MGGRKLDKDWEIMEWKVKRAIEEIEREKGKGREKRRRWWDEVCEKERGEKNIEGLEKERVRDTGEANRNIRSYVKKGGKKIC